MVETDFVIVNYGQVVERSESLGESEFYEILDEL